MNNILESSVEKVSHHLKRFLCQNEKKQTWQQIEWKRNVLIVKMIMYRKINKFEFPCKVIKKI